MKIKIGILALICTAFFAFHYWMAFPGYITPDTIRSLDLAKGNWHPVIISYALQVLYFFFGKKVCLFLLLQLVPLYFGIFIISLAFLKRYNSVYAFFCVFPAFIGNIFFQSIKLHSSSLSPLWIFLFYSLVFYQLMAPPKTFFMRGFLWVCIISMFFLSLLSRHNALFQVYPACFIWIYQWQQKRKFNFLNTGYMILLTALLTLNFVIHVPRWISSPICMHPATHVYRHQIVGMCVLAENSNCIPTDWYSEGKSWNDFVVNYHLSPRLADWTLKDQFFKYINHNDLKSLWLRTLLKYPKYYLTHIYKNFFKPMFFDKYRGLEIQKISIKKNRFEDTVDSYDIKNNTFSYINHSLVQEKIYFYLGYYLPIIPNYIFISSCFIFSFLSFVLLFKEKYNNILIFVFSTSIGGFIGSLFFICFSPFTDSRYVYPVLISAILAFYGVVEILHTTDRKLRK